MKELKQLTQFIEHSLWVLRSIASRFKGSMPFRRSKVQSLRGLRVQCTSCVQNSEGAINGEGVKRRGSEKAEKGEGAENSEGAKNGEVVKRRLFDWLTTSGAEWFGVLGSRFAFRFAKISVIIRFNLCYLCSNKRARECKMARERKGEKKARERKTARERKISFWVLSLRGSKVQCTS